MFKTRKPWRIWADPKENGTEILANWTISLKASVELLINLSQSERNFAIRNYYYDMIISSKTELRPTKDRN
jgi:hypothetical protein